jgi:hypothetical protein
MEQALVLLVAQGGARSVQAEPVYLHTSAPPEFSVPTKKYDPLISMEGTAMLLGSPPHPASIWFCIHAFAWTGPENPNNRQNKTKNTGSNLYFELLMVFIRLFIAFFDFMERALHQTAYQVVFPVPRFTLGGQSP